MKPRTLGLAKAITVDVLSNYSTYEAAGRKHGVGRSTAERHLKALVRMVLRDRPIDGIDEDAIESLQRLRQHRDSVVREVMAFEGVMRRASPRRVTDKDIAVGASRVRARSENANRDVALLYVLFCTGAKPIEIARLLVRDYVAADGTARMQSELREQAAARGRGRPLYFDSVRTCAAIDAYLVERARLGMGLGTSKLYRGLDPDSALFLTEHCRPFEVRGRGAGDSRQTSPVLVATYRVIFRRAGWEGVTAQDARRQVAQRLTEKGADKQQVGKLLGLTSNRSVTRLLERPSQPLESLVKDLV